jgi:hypothetical protein
MLEKNVGFDLYVSRKHVIDLTMSLLVIRTLSVHSIDFEIIRSNNFGHII